jgi:hypothetical protein
MFDRTTSPMRWTQQIAKAFHLCGRRVHWLAMAASLLLLGTSTGLSPTASETEVKAAVIYNFAKFVEWPAEAFSSDTAPIQLAVFGDEDFGNKLRVLMTGQKAHGRSVDVKNISSPQDAKNFHMVFVAGAENRRTAQILEATKKSPVLTVGEAEPFLDAGGMITLVLEDAQLKFEVNPEAAQKVKLEISSRLLRLARKRSPK